MNEIQISSARGNNEATAAGSEMDSASNTLLPQTEQQRLFDLSLIQQQQNQLQEPINISEEKSDEVTSHHVPPLESLTADDDNTSVSSVSTQGSLQRRSMFSQYWKKTGQEPPRYLPRTSSCGAAIPSPISSPSNNTGFGFLATPPEHEEVLDVQVPNMDATSVVEAAAFAKIPRRTMFPPRGNSYNYAIRTSSSAPSLSSVRDQDSDATSFVSSGGSPRKIRSYSHLLSRQPSSSCLRESRFSPNKNAASSTSCGGVRRNSSATTMSTNTDSASIASGSSVRFDLAATSVRHYDVPQERYAEKGWSDFFH